MAQMTIDDDLRDLLNDGKITWAQAGTIRDGRLRDRRLAKQETKHNDALKAVIQQREKIKAEENAILSGDENSDTQPVATEPGALPGVE